MPVGRGDALRLGGCGREPLPSAEVQRGATRTPAVATGAFAQGGEAVILTPVSLAEGLYELLLTDALARRLDPGRSQAEALRGDISPWLIDAIAHELAPILEDLADGRAETATAQLELVNELLATVRRRLAEKRPDLASRIDVDSIAAPPRLLRSVAPAESAPSAPAAGLVVPWLFTASKDSPSLLHELRHELSACDGVDVLVSFIRLSGVRKLRDVLRPLSAVDAQGLPRTRIRVLTTTYTGATELRALDELARLPGCEVRVSLDGRRTRLHAKAWLFRRASGFGSAYVGSANLSGAALTGGMEWTVKITQRGQAALFERAVANFETLWADSEFERYDPDNEGHRAALAGALRREAQRAGTADGEAIAASDSALPLPFFDLLPKSYQQEMLDALAQERARGRWRSLVVAATGTGKTVVAAFDYRNLCRQFGGRPRLLYVAHRAEILRQARRTYREVLREGDFGELLTGRDEPREWAHLFATIDSVAARDLVTRFGAGNWHIVVIDECHRLAADRFATFADAVRPRVLLGLTATPERSDGQPILQHFDPRPDGSPAVELRLWSALDLQLLAPFEYYACDDDTDFGEVPWDQAGETAALDRLLTGNDVRARLVVREWQRLASEPRRCRAIVFCVSVAHAEFTASRLNAAGLPALCVTGATDAETRRRAPERLARGELCALVTVDLFNEGVDLPSVDTLLLLRPTQSPVLFQQQIGRGLRLAPGKESCLVLDFVGQHRRDFRFDRLLGIHLQPQTREQVLRSLREVSAQTWARLTRELQAHVALRGVGSVKLATFLADQALELDDVYRGSGAHVPTGWTGLKRSAGLLVAEPGPEDDYFARRLTDLLHLDDPFRVDLLGAVASEPVLSKAAAPDRHALGVQMLAYQIDGRHGAPAGPQSFLERLRGETAIRAELIELAEALRARGTCTPTPVPGLEDTPLCLHASYSTREVLTATGRWTASQRAPFRSGVLPLHDRRVELFFVTLDKSTGFHERTSYRDYAISADLFHWQSQNSASPARGAGKRYLESPGNGWTFQLFVRSRRGEGFHACGPVTLQSASGERPMSIHWQLQCPLPVRLFRQFSVLRGA